MPASAAAPRGAAAATPRGTTPHPGRRRRRPLSASSTDASCPCQLPAGLLYRPDLALSLTFTDDVKLTSIFGPIDVSVELVKYGSWKPPPFAGVSTTVARAYGGTAPPVK